KHHQRVEAEALVTWSHAHFAIGTHVGDAINLDARDWDLVTKGIRHDANRMSPPSQFFRHFSDGRRSAMVCRKRTGGNHGNGETRHSQERLKRPDGLIE